jgi:hypothetical protein
MARAVRKGFGYRWVGVARFWFAALSGAVKKKSVALETRSADSKINKLII